MPVLNVHILDKPWIHGLKPPQQPLYRHVTDLNYWTFLGSFNKCGIITLSYKATTSDSFEEIHQVVLDGISKNMSSLVQYGKYGSITTTHTLTMKYYVIKFVLEAYILQDDTTCDRQIVSFSELVFKSLYLICTQ